VHINTVRKFDFVKNGDRPLCHFVLQHTKIHEEELNFSKKFFSGRPVLHISVFIYVSYSLCSILPAHESRTMCESVHYDAIYVG
jgi:hypothetical protein